MDVPGVKASELDAKVAAKVADGTSATATALSATYARGQGSTVLINGPTLPTLPAGTEYIWHKTDGAGTLLDILSGVA